MPFKPRPEFSPSATTQGAFSRRQAPCYGLRPPQALTSAAISVRTRPPLRFAMLRSIPSTHGLKIHSSCPSRPRILPVGRGAFRHSSPSHNQFHSLRFSVPQSLHALSSVRCTHYGQDRVSKCDALQPSAVARHLFALFYPAIFNALAWTSDEDLSSASNCRLSKRDMMSLFIHYKNKGRIRLHIIPLASSLHSFRPMRLGNARRRCMPPRKAFALFLSGINLRLAIMEGQRVRQGTCHSRCISKDFTQDRRT